VAELRVERKRPNIWRWIVLLVLIAIVVWALVELFGAGVPGQLDETPAGASIAPEISPPPAGAVPFAGRAG